MLARWFYDGFLSIDDDDDTPAAQEIQVLCKAYITGDKLGAVHIRETVMDGIVERITQSQSYYVDNFKVEDHIPVLMEAFPAESIGQLRGRPADPRKSHNRAAAVRDHKDGQKGQRLLLPLHAEVADEEAEWRQTGAMEDEAWDNVVYVPRPL